MCLYIVYSQNFLGAVPTKGLVYDFSPYSPTYQSFNSCVIYWVGYTTLGIYQRSFIGIRTNCRVVFHMKIDMNRVLIGAIASILSLKSNIGVVNNLLGGYFRKKCSFSYRTQ